jgi:hypothetical protein
MPCQHALSRGGQAIRVAIFYTLIGRLALVICTPSAIKVRHRFDKCGPFGNRLARRGHNNCDYKYDENPALRLPIFMPYRQLCDVLEEMSR